MGDELEPAPFTMWEHWIGKFYLVICCAQLEHDSTKVVVYQSIENGSRWVRPLVEFMTKFEACE